MIITAIKNIIHPEKRSAANNTPAAPSVNIPPSPSPNAHEVRFLASTLSLEDRAGKKTPTIVGYAAVFNSRSQNLGYFYEIVKPGAFTKTLRSGPDVVGVIEHSGGLLTLGRKSAGTLRLDEDTRGLKIEIDAPDTSAGRDVVELLRRGDLHSMSFSFRTIEDAWHVEDGIDIRELIEVELYDVSIVSSPAYLDTSASIRSLLDTHEEGKRRLSQVANNNNDGDDKDSDNEQLRLQLEIDMLELG